jgi:hypothetical protein
VACLGAGARGAPGQPAPTLRRHGADRARHIRPAGTAAQRLRRRQRLPHALAAIARALAQLPVRLHRSARQRHRPAQAPLRLGLLRLASAMRSFGAPLEPSAHTCRRLPRGACMLGLRRLGVAHAISAAMGRWRSCECRTWASARTARPCWLSQWTRPVLACRAHLRRGSLRPAQRTPTTGAGEDNGIDRNQN